MYLGRYRRTTIHADDGQTLAAEPVVTTAPSAAERTVPAVKAATRGLGRLARAAGSLVKPRTVTVEKVVEVPVERVVVERVEVPVPADSVFFDDTTIVDFLAEEQETAGQTAGTPS
ncbi:hypothetical protein [Brevibacterium oceani]|uniref:hypothetical protein n=1 Tax=Brevibacterium oceani TaxID=358099 RepID=UPI0015E6F880|nr:hypothetical protein [Brevibacterium oceani]